MNNEKLLPCPFCGNAANVFDPETSINGWGVGCVCGGNQESVYISKDAAIKAWNTRNQPNSCTNALLLISLKDILSRFQSCISGGNGELEDDAPAIKKAQTAILIAEGQTTFEDMWSGYQAACANSPLPNEADVVEVIHREFVRQADNSSGYVRRLVDDYTDVCLDGDFDFIAVLRAITDAGYNIVKRG